MATKLNEIRQLSRRYPKLQTLINYVNYENLKDEHNRQTSDKAVGIDGVTKQMYGEHLDENLNNLLIKMKAFQYKPKPVRRTYIPKANGKLRPLGIPSYEDKLVQGVMAKVLNEVYEPRFLDCSYGFRENKSVHDAIREVNQTIMTKKANYILDSDIKGYFDNVNHKWLIKFLEHDIEDKNFIRYIVRFLKSGYVENGMKIRTDKGTPQGGLISPVLANVYLHYALDDWFSKVVKPKLKGESYLVRFADDFIIMFEYENEAKEVYQRLKERFLKFGLELAEDKTRILPFGRYKGNKDTFDFLGFKHYNSKTRFTNKYTVGHKISLRKKRLFKQNLNEWLKLYRNLDTTTYLEKLNIKLTGAMRFYGISGMFEEIKGVYTFAKKLTFKWTNKRSQRKSYEWDEFHLLWDKFITKPRVYVDIWEWKQTC